MDRAALILWTVCVGGAALSLLITLAARRWRRVIPPSCARCRFVIDDAVRQAGRCPECGTDLRGRHRIITRGRTPRVVKLVALVCLLTGLGAGGIRLGQLEQKGELDSLKPSWLLALQLGPAPVLRQESIASQLVLRARAGMPGLVARSIVQRWKADLASGGTSSRFTPIAEELFASGLVDAETIERYTRTLCGFNIKPPAGVGADRILTIESSVTLLGSTRLRLEIERARFRLDDAELPRQTEPTIIISDAGLIGSASSMWHSTTNYIVLEPSIPIRPGSVVSASYLVRVFAGQKPVSEWTATTTAGFGSAKPSGSIGR